MTEQPLAHFDPFIAHKLKHDLDKFEIRGNIQVDIRNWIAKALVHEQLLALLRTGHLNIVGWEKDQPKFEQHEIH